MKTLPNDRFAPSIRALIAPALIVLVSASLLMGFTFSRRNAHTAPPISMVSADRYAQQGDDDRSTEADDTANDIDPVDDYHTAIDLLKRRHYGAAIDSSRTRQLTYEAIRGMLYSLQDPFTSFLDPDEWVQFQTNVTRGDFEGIGAELTDDQRSVRISTPIDGGPAQRAGLKAGDVIVRVENRPVTGLSVDDAVRLIQGPSGTHVTLTILRGRQRLRFTILRARVELPIVRYWMEDNRARIGHIVLQEFNEKSLDQLNRAFIALQQQGMRALVFDLRDNPGGLLDVAVQLASVFVPRNSVAGLKNNAVIIREGSGQEHGRQLMAVDTAYTKRVPLAVLVNGDSASASEIVSGAIKDYGAGALIGERTYGKGCVQTLYPLDDGSCLRLTTALYFPPKGYDINYRQDDEHMRIPNTGGLLPDIEVAAPAHWNANNVVTNAAAPNDTQLLAALDYLRARLNGESVAVAAQQVQTKYRGASTRVAAVPNRANLR